MTTARKLLTITVMAVLLFVGAFATSFFAMHVAFADDHAEAKPEDGKVEDHEEHEDPTKYFNFLGSPGEHYGKDITGGKFGDGKQLNEHGVEVSVAHEEEMSAPFIFMVLNFILLLIILTWKGKPIVEKLAADRHDQIKTALAEAAKLRKQAEDKLAEYANKLEKADAEIAALVAGLRSDAEADKKRILEAAERQAVQMQKDAEVRIAAEIELARTTLTREVSYAATMAAEKVLREKTTPSDQQQLIGAFITGVQSVAQPAKDVR